LVRLRSANHAMAAVLEAAGMVVPLRLRAGD
jgi:hypothetical protein